MKPTLRQRWLGGALVATLGATAFTAWWSSGSESGDVVAVPRSRSERRALPSSDRRQVDAMVASSAGGEAVAGSSSGSEQPRIQRGDWPAVSVDGLAAWGQSPEPVSKAVPIVAPVVVAAPVAPPPVAPPLAYRYVGRLVEDGRQRAMLVSPQRSILVKERELIDGQWRVEHIGDEEIQWLWVPGALPGRLAIASSS
jgi:hypothetical protein